MSDTGNSSKNPNSTNDRRRFLKNGLGILGAALVAKVSAPAVADAQAGTADVKESDANAKALGYHVDAGKVDVKKFPKRAGAAGQKQFCYNCMFYQAKGDPKASAKAPCTIFANKNVLTKAWCNSWAQNPKVTT